MCESHDVDPEGDVIISLAAPAKAFATWNEPEESPSAFPEDGLDSAGLGGDIEVMAELPGFHHGENAVRLETSSPAPPPELRLRVSSKHLVLASPQFKRTLSATGMEETIVQPDGCRHISMEEGFDPKALLILMNIIHCRTSKVPRSLDLETLAKVSVLVDYLECYDAVEVFSDMWIKQLEEPLPTEYNRDLILWICIAFVFHQPALFKAATHTAIFQSENQIPTLGLPIRGKIVDSIDRRREELLDELISTLHGLVDKLRDSTSCSFECDSILLGALMRQIHPKGLLYPRPSKPFLGFSLATSMRTIRGLRSPAWRSSLTVDEEAAALWISEQERRSGKPKRKGRASSSLGWEMDEQPSTEPETHGCGFHALFGPRLDNLEASVTGFDLEELGYAPGPFKLGDRRIGVSLGLDSC